MERSLIIYGAVVAVLIIFLSLVAYTPMHAHEDEEGSLALYSGLSIFCHQKLSRSICVFEDGSIAECTEHTGKYVPGDRDEISTMKNGLLGYKFPICARDIGLYGFLLVGAIIYALLFRLDEKGMYPPILLILAIVPISIDGGMQFLSSMGVYVLGVEYESTNLIRFLTGAIAGFAVPFYLFPILNRMFGERI
jgi:uncharacterized membrane protein